MFCFSLDSQSCAYALVRFRHKNHSVRVSVVFTNAVTQTRTVVTGFPALLPLTPPSLSPPPVK